MRLPADLTDPRGQSEPVPTFERPHNGHPTRLVDIDGEIVDASPGPAWSPKAGTFAASMKALLVLGAFLAAYLAWSAARS